MNKKLALKLFKRLNNKLCSFNYLYEFCYIHGQMKYKFRRPKTHWFNYFSWFSGKYPNELYRFLCGDDSIFTNDSFPCTIFDESNTLYTSMKYIGKCDSLEELALKMDLIGF
jgi:hypothetical protein